METHMAHWTMLVRVNAGAIEKLAYLLIIGPKPPIAGKTLLRLGAILPYPPIQHSRTQPQVRLDRAATALALQHQSYSISLELRIIPFSSQNTAHATPPSSPKIISAELVV